jgi:glycosyltransferase involved in cell wall biosynthesis
MKTILVVASKDNAFYNFRKEVIIGLLDKGYRVVLSSPYGKKIDYFTERGCEFIETNVDRRGLSPLADIRLMLNYCKLIDLVKADLMLTYTSKCSIYGGMAARIKKIPSIINNSGQMNIPDKLKVLSPLISFLYRVGDGKASCMMYQNHSEMEELNKILKNRVPYKLIPGSGVNLDEFSYKSYPGEKEKITFNFVARIMKGKGIEEFLECAKVIHEKYPHTNFVIYGEHEDDTYKSIIDDYVSKGIVKYAGVVFNMKPAIEAAHAVIHPSYFEGMTNVCLEHSAMGRVCIASNIPGCKEIIDDGKTGFLFEMKNIQQLVEKVELFLNLTYEQKEKMGMFARKKMVIEFDRNTVKKVYFEEIQRLLENK